jgi:hypothetical protein
VIHKSKQFLILAASAVTLSMFTAAADTCVNDNTLSTYLAAGFSCTIGDKTFSNFSYSSSATNATSISASGITVNTLDGVTPFDPTGEIGLGFNASWVAAGLGSDTQSLIGFTVTVTPGSSLLIEDTGVAQLSGVTGDGSATVVEDSCGPAPCAPGPWSTLTLDDSSGATRMADTTFTPVTSVEVSKNILVESNTLTSFAHLSFVADTFSQTATPEPISASLLLDFGIIACVVLRKRLKAVRPQ